MFLQNGSRNLLFGLMLVFVSLNQQLSSDLFQSQSGRWSIPQKVPLYSQESNPPILIAEQNRIVHAFSSQWRGSLRVIVYNQWVYERGWTSPTDIIIFPNGEARVTDVLLDKNNTFHIVYFGGDGTGANIYYSKAPASAADDAHAWSVPVLIGSNAGDPEGAVFAQSEQGTLYVAYNGREFGNSIYVVESSDNGENWTDPSPLFFALTEAPNIAQLQLMIDKSGELHALWGVFTLTAQGRGVYYARSKDGLEWSQPILLAQSQDGLGTQRPTIIEYEDQLLVLYNLSLKIMMRRSSDGGLTWDEPSLLFSRHVGVNGDMSLVIDGNNALHLFFGQRITGNPDIHGMWHSLFMEGRWTEPEAIIKGPLVRDPITRKGFDPYFARAVVSQGNVILVTWRTDPAAGDNGVWYSFEKIDAPELPLIELSSPVTPENNPTVAADVPTESPVTAPTPSRVVQVPTDRPALQSNPGLPIVIGSVLSVVLILIVVVMQKLNGTK